MIDGCSPATFSSPFSLESAADAETAHEASFDALFNVEISKGTQLAAKRALPQGTIANSLQRVGVEPENARAYEDEIRVDLEGVINETLDKAYRAIRDFIGERD